MLRWTKEIGVAVILAGALGASAAGPADGPFAALGPAVARAAGPVDRTVQRLQAAQRRDGGFATDPGARASDPASSVWAALALAAVGVHPADQPARGTTALAYLRRHADDLRDTGDLARLVLVLRASRVAVDTDGERTADALRRRQRLDGAFPDAAGPGPGRVEATAFAILALAAGPEDDRAAAARGAAWLTTARTGDGWGDAAGATPRTRPTALALQALRAQSGLASDSVGQAFLLDRISTDDGGIADRAGRRSDPASTAWGTQGLLAVGVNPLTTRQSTGGLAGEDGENRTVRTYLHARQRDDGGFGSTIRTAQVLPGLNGTVLPLAAVERGSDRAGERAPATPNAARSGGAGGSEGLDDAKATNDGGTTTSPASPEDAGGDGGDDGDGSGASAVRTTGSGGASAPAQPTTTTPATTTTSAAAPPPPAGGQVSGSVVSTGDQPTGPGVASGGDAGDEDDAALLLALAALLAVALGAGLERRRPRTTSP